MLNRLFFIKAFHSLIFFFMSACVLYVPYAALSKTFNWALVLALAGLFTEFLALIFNRGRCPLTSLAEKHGVGKASVTDMFLPAVVARNVFKVAIVLVPAELVLLAVRYFTM